MTKGCVAALKGWWAPRRGEGERRIGKEIKRPQARKTKTATLKKRERGTNRWPTEASECKEDLENVKKKQKEALFVHLASPRNDS